MIKSLLNYVNRLRYKNTSEPIFLGEFHNDISNIVLSELDPELNNAVQKDRILTKSENIDFIL